jgi:cystathionine beta-lyase
MTEVVADTLGQLRARTSEKWAAYPADVLPLFVAEMDYPLCPAVAQSMIDRIVTSDTGYVGGPGAVASAFARFAHRRWGWDVDAGMVRTTTDVSVAIVETLRQVIEPGDAVIITPPVYPPFYGLVPEAGGVTVEVPLTDEGKSWSLDLPGLEAAFAAGAKVLLLCNPHNPLGLVHTVESLAAVAELASRFGAVVVSDEIHAPLTHRGIEFTPYLSVSDAAREHGICVTSASKAFNLAGVKCALMVAASDRMCRLLDAMSFEVGFRTSLLGLHASTTAFEDESAEQWLDGTITAIENSLELLQSLLTVYLPGVTFRMPAASYLAWLDLRVLEWGDDPSVRVLETARVALNPGPTFGEQGKGFARINVACSPEVLTEAILRIAAVR